MRIPSRFIIGVSAALLLIGTASGGSQGWWDRLLPHKSVPAEQGAALAVASQPVTLEVGREKRVRYVAETPVALLPGGPAHYQRFELDESVPLARISLRVLADRNAEAPRFTVFSPQLVVLDKNGQIRRIVPLDQLRLDIRPFHATQLRECVIVSNLHSFLLATDPGRLGQQYEFNARANAGSHPDHGFYRGSSTMKVFLSYADTGIVMVSVTPAPGQDSTCHTVPE